MNLFSLGFDPRTAQPVAQSLYRLSYRGPHEGVKAALKYLCCKIRMGKKWV